MSEVFISYSKADRAVAEALADDLTACGFDVWWDTELYAGDDFHAVIRSEIGEAKAVIVIWSADAVASLWVRGEAQEGFDAGKLISSHVPEFELSKVPLNFRAIHTECVDNRDNIIRAVRRLIRTCDNADVVEEAGRVRNENVGEPAEWTAPAEMALYALLRSIPTVMETAYNHALPDWNTGAGNVVRQATYQVIEVAERIWHQLADFYPPNHFGKPAKQYFSEFVGSRFDLRYGLIEPDGHGTAGSMIHPLVAYGVLRDVQGAIVLTVRLLMLFREERSDFNIEEWERQLETATSGYTQ